MIPTPRRIPQCARPSHFADSRRLQPSTLMYFPNVNLIVQNTCGKTTNVETFDLVVWKTANQRRIVSRRPVPSAKDRPYWMNAACSSLCRVRLLALESISSARIKDASDEFLCPRRLKREALDSPGSIEPP